MVNLSKFKKIIILKGGFSEEHEISLKTGNKVYNALKKKYNVRSIIVNKNINKLISNIKTFKPDIIFNALHGNFGEDGQIQSILNLLKIPYTHSNVQTSSIGMNKFFSKIIFENIGINCPQGKVISIENLNKIKFEKPIIIKPINGGSSIDIYKISNAKELKEKKILQRFSKKKDLLVEEYIPGRELTVGILDEKICGITEIVSGVDFYDYENKYINIARHIQNPKLPENIKKKIFDFALRAHNVIGCNCISRSDFRYNPSNNKIYLLEINTQPGLTENSLLPEMAETKGINFLKLCEILMKNAKCERL